MRGKCLSEKPSKWRQNRVAIFTVALKIEPENLVVNVRMIGDRDGSTDDESGFERSRGSMSGGSSCNVVLSIAPPLCKRLRLPPIP